MFCTTTRPRVDFRRSTRYEAHVRRVLSQQVIANYSIGAVTYYYPRRGPFLVSCCAQRAERSRSAEIVVIRGARSSVPVSSTSRTDEMTPDRISSIRQFCPFLSNGASLYEAPAAVLCIVNPTHSPQNRGLNCYRRPTGACPPDPRCSIFKNLTSPADPRR